MRGQQRTRTRFTTAFRPTVLDHRVGKGWPGCLIRIGQPPLDRVRCRFARIRTTYANGHVRSNAHYFGQVGLAAQRERNGLSTCQLTTIRRSQRRSQVVSRRAHCMSYSSRLWPPYPFHEWSNMPSIWALVIAAAHLEQRRNVARGAVLFKQSSS